MTDYVTTSNRRQHVIDQLQAYSGVKQMTPGHAFICCPFHSEKTPSCRVFHSDTTQVPGYFKCYGCPAKGGWDDLAEALGLVGFAHRKPRDEFINFALLDASGKGKVETLVMDKMEFRDLPRNKLWRSIKTNLLIALGARICVVDKSDVMDKWGKPIGKLKPAVWLPVYIRGKLRGYIKARMKKHETLPSYINASGAWSKTHGLFPFDYAVKVMHDKGLKTMAAVEGPRDALHLLQRGIPAVCILGTQSWTEKKAKQLELAGVERLITIMDGDCAGKRATELIVDMSSSMFKVIAVKLWALKGSPYRQFDSEDEPSKAAKAAGVSLWDPATMPDELLTRIKKKYFTPKEK